MRRFLRILAWAVGVLIAIPLLAVAALLVLLNLPVGRNLVTGKLGPLTGGMIEADGLAGRFPDHLLLRHLAVRDADGAWLVAENIRLDWSPLALLSKTAHVDALTAEGVHVLRLPASSPPKPGAASSSSSFSLPVRVVLDRLHVTRLEIDAPVGAAATVQVNGSGALASLQQGTVALDIKGIDNPGTYHLAGTIDPAHIKADLNVEEPQGGLIAGLAHLPDLGGPLSIHAAIDGPRSAEVTRLSLAAGPLRANAHGTLDLANQAADLDLTATAPAMAPRPDTSWQSVAIDAHVHGPFTKPEASGHVAVQGLKAGGAAISSFTAELSGNQGQVNLKAAIAGLVIPGPKPDLLAAAPITLTADVRLDAPDRPVTFTLSHPLIAATGTAKTGDALALALDLRLPDLAPFAAIGGIDLQGHTALHVQMDEHGGAELVAVDGTLGLTGGMAQPVALIGDRAKIGTTIALDGGKVTLSRFDLAGARLHLTAHGTDNDGALDLAYALDLPDMSALAPTVTGTVNATGTVKGQQTNIAVATDLKGDLGAPGVERAPVTATVRLTGLPGAPAGDVTVQGAFDGAPINLALHAARQPDGSMTADLTRADWKSLHAAGKFALAKGATLPTGTATLKMTQLADLRPVVGQPVSGSVEAKLDLAQDANLTLEARNVGIPGSSVGRASVTAHVANLTTAPVVKAQATLDGIAAAGIGGNAKVEMNGKQDALAIRLTAGLTNLAGADARIAATAALNAVAKQVAVNTLTVDWHDEPVRLLAPVRISFADGVSIDRLRLGIRTATLDLAGKLTPKLDLTANLRNLTAELAKPFVPDLAADGSASVEAKLTGTPAAPTGTVRVTARNIRMRTGPARALPPASLLATLDLAGKSTRVDAHLTAGATRLAVTGTAPLNATGALDLRATGAVDLALTDPILTASGRRLRGKVTLDATATGTPTAPRFGGTIRLAGGEFQDYVQGAHLTDMNATIVAAGDTIRIASFTAHAGAGTLAASGTVGVTAPGIPVDLTLTAHNATPLQSDLLTATLDADLKLRGQVKGRLDASGSIHIDRAVINVPDHLPSSVAVLNVRNAGAPPPPPPAPGPLIGLDLTISAAQAIFIRGHGLDAEMAGRLHLGGTSQAPRPSGGFKLRQGTFSLAGTNLTFTKGEVGFDGAGLQHKIDPTLDFAVTNTNSNVASTLTITGYADAPKFTLTSIPELPPDEVLAHLLFGQSSRDIGPFQYAQLAQALATLSGVGGGVATDPLGSIRSGLGLDRLTVGSTANGSGPALQGGRYIAHGVYLGAQQGTGGDTQGTLQIDLYKGLKLETNVGTSASGGNSVGLTYQFEYK